MKTTQILCSIITICKNNKDGLKLTVDSLKNLDKARLQFIFIDGLSTDGSLLQAENSALFDILVSEIDTGVYDAMNKGILQAKGRYSIFCNAGDQLISAEFEKMLDYANELTHKCIIHGNLLLSNGITQIPKIAPRFIRLMKIPAYHPACLYETTILKSCPFDTSYKIAADFKQLKLLYNNRVYFARVPFTVSIFDTSGISSKATPRLKEYRRALRELGYNDFTITSDMIVTACNIYIHKHFSGIFARIHNCFLRLTYSFPFTFFHRPNTLPNDNQ